jgi:hypothetical protein
MNSSQQFETKRRFLRPFTRLRPALAPALAPCLATCLVLASASESKAQEARVPQSGSIVFLVNSGSGLALDISGSQAAQSSLVIQNTYYANYWSQQWTLTSVGGGFYTFKNRASAMCLDVPGSSTSAGLQLQQYSCNGTNAQSFSVTPNSDGTFAIKNRNSGLCLDIRASSKEPGAAAQQYGCNGTSAQKFMFSKTSGPAPTPIPTPVPTPVPTPTSTPAPNATPAPVGKIRNKTDLLNFMHSLEGKGAISGQYVANNTSFNEIQNIFNLTGKWVGSLGIDYYWYGQRANPADTAVNANAKKWWANGGLVVLTTHTGTPSLTPSGAPANGGVYDVPGQSNPFTGYINWNELVTPGTATNRNLNAALDSIANGIYDLASAGVVVIYRPYHENDGGWFWWGTNSHTAIGGGNPSRAQFIALWRYTHDYISNKAGPNGQPLGNYIAWAFTGVDQSKGVLNNWPDDASGRYVDIVGNDIYHDSPANDSNGVERYKAEVATGKVVIVAEFGPASMPFDEMKLIGAMKSTFPKAVLWQQWSSSSWGIDYTQNAWGAMNDPYVLNRGFAPTP